MCDILIKNATIITMDNEMNILKNMEILIENGNIIVIKKKIICKPKKVIDASGCIVFPGLCNTHTHVGMTILRGYAEDISLYNWLNDKIWNIEKYFTPKTVYFSSLLGCLEMIKSGTTTFCDMYFHMYSTKKAVYDSGMRGYLSYGMIDNYDTIKGKYEIKNTIKFINSFKNKENERIKVMLGPHSTNTCSIEFLLNIKEIEKKYNLKTNIHLLETKAELDEFKKKYNQSPIKYLDSVNFLDKNTLAAHCVWVSNEDIKLLSKNNVTVSHNPISNMKLGSGIARIYKMINNKVNITLGTDSCASNNNLNLFEEIKITPLLQKGLTKNSSILSSKNILKMVTSNVSNFFEDKIGMIKVGYKADIIILEVNKKPHLQPYIKNTNIYSLLVYSMSGYEVRDTIINGKLVMENKKVITIDEEKIIDNSKKELEYILNKMKI